MLLFIFRYDFFSQVLIPYSKGQRFEADLLENGKIKWDGSEEEFGTPSAWAHHCKRLVNPIKRSGCGWASVSLIYL